MSQPNLFMAFWSFWQIFGRMPKWSFFWRVNECTMVWWMQLARFTMKFDPCYKPGQVRLLLCSWLKIKGAPKMEFWTNEWSRLFSCCQMAYVMFIQDDVNVVKPGQVSFFLEVCWLLLKKAKSEAWESESSQVGLLLQGFLHDRKVQFWKSCLMCFVWESKGQA